MNSVPFIRLAAGGLFLFLGTLVLAVSLLKSVPVVHSSQGEPGSPSFYVNGEVLPDHIFYPILMVRDRLRLEAAEPTERLYLQTEYANRRLRAGLDLLAKDNQLLALTTITKAQKYLLRSSEEAMDSQPPVGQAVLSHVVRTIEFHSAAVASVKDQFSDQDRAVLDKLQAELEVVAQRLSEQFPERSL